MHFVSFYSFDPAKRDQVVARFKETGGAPPAGVKVLGRWHDVAGGRGITIYEASDPVAMSAWGYAWNDLMKLEVVPVVNDEQLVKVLSGGGK